MGQLGGRLRLRILEVLLMLTGCALSLTSCNLVTTQDPSSTGPEAATATAVPRVTDPPPPVSTGSLVPIAAQTIPLSGEWRFAVDPDTVGENEGWADPGLDDCIWTTVTVPHTWGVMPEYADYDGVAWYRQSFMLPGEAQDAHLRLRFDAVFYLSDVWLNGEYLGQHEGGYTPFEFDVSGIARPGAENVVAVRVDNTRAMDRIPATLRRTWSYDWWNWGGIVRDVSLEMTSKAYVASQQVVAVPRLTGTNEADWAKVTTKVRVRNKSETHLEGMVVADVLDEGDGFSVLETRPAVPISLTPMESTELELAVEIRQPNLWHFDHPHLYRWSAALLGPNGEPLHKSETTFGIRLIELKDARFYLNGEPMRLIGLTRHADSPWHGLAETSVIMAQDYDDLKKLNMVFSRPVHYPQHEFILDYCDRHGILLIPEVPAWQLTAGQMKDEQMRQLQRQQLREMIEAAFNHPSVWAWSIGNEYESKTVEGYEFTRDMIDHVKSLDATRPVGFASNRMDSQPTLDATRYADFVMMNQYFGTWVGPKTGLGQALDGIHAAWPDKAVVISEFGFEPHWNTRWGPPSSTLDPDEYYFIPEDLPSTAEDADVQRQHVIREQMEVFRSKPFIAGAIFWTYQDYRTPSGFVMGVVDSERNQRASWYLLREEYSPALIESVTFACQPEGQRSADLILRSRGPEDLPSYTLRGYSLHWAVTSPGGEKTFADRELALPALEPGAEWTGSIQWVAPQEEYVLVVSVIRPTGFAVIERIYDAQGALLGK
jgi:beta-galactosidase/beta-glucuronidase